MWPTVWTNSNKSAIKSDFAKTGVGPLVNRPDPHKFPICLHFVSPSCCNDMPNTKSAKKRFRQDVVRRLRNRAARSALRGHLRRVRQAVTEGKLDVAETEFRVAAKKLDQAGSRRLIHPNTASRLKSRLQHMIRKAKLPAA